MSTGIDFGHEVHTNYLTEFDSERNSSEQLGVHGNIIRYHRFKGRQLYGQGESPYP